ncbi:MAG: exo-alpha-sialidase [Actinobacteria bacterium]|nr:exo-alpha-sialidase [Actinomycetota bacterium]
MLLASAASAARSTPGDLSPAAARLLDAAHRSHGPLPFAVSAAGPGCLAEPTPGPDVHVNCRAADDGAANDIQSEVSVAARGRTVVVAFNDFSVCCDEIALTGYAVSTDGGRTFVDRGPAPPTANVKPFGDPWLTKGSDGSIYLTTLALSSADIGTAESEIAIYRMRPGRTTFELFAIPVRLGWFLETLADKAALAIDRQQGQDRFSLTWTLEAADDDAEDPIMLTDSLGGATWRTTRVSDGDVCGAWSQPTFADRRLFVSWLELPALCAGSEGEGEFPDLAAADEPTGDDEAEAGDWSGENKIAEIDLRTGAPRFESLISDVKGTGDAVIECGSAERQVIETAPGHAARLEPGATVVADGEGVLYAVWSDRPDGVGGDDDNATRIWLSFSRDHARTWSEPRVVSGPLGPGMRDRFMPWLTLDGDRLAAMWYHRVPALPEDLLQVDVRYISLAYGNHGPAPISPEIVVSSRQFPLVTTVPNPFPAANCYMGDYNGITSDHGQLYVAWGDNRLGDPDIFLAHPATAARTDAIR